MDVRTDPQNGLRQGLDTLRRRAWWLSVSVVLVAGCAFGFSVAEHKTYDATAALVFNSETQSEAVAGLPTVANSDPVGTQDTNVQLVSLGDMAARTAAAVGDGFTAQKISDAITVQPVGDTSVVDVTASASSAALAARIANTYASAFVSEQESRSRAYYASALRVVVKQLANLSAAQRAGVVGLNLQERAQSLGVLAELQSGSVELAQRAKVPQSASSPKVLRNLLLGLLLGVLLGGAAALTRERLDQTIRQPNELRTLYGLPLLGVVPQSPAIGVSARVGEHGSTEWLPSGEADAFRLIRAHLQYYNVDREMRTLLITSAAAGDGKTTVARLVAAAAADTGSRAIILECDLRRPTFSQVPGLRVAPGLADILLGRASFTDATQSLVPGPDGGVGSRTLDVIVAGAVRPPNPEELMGSRAMAKVIADAKEAYDFVVIDTPPLAIVSDAFPLLPVVDGVIIVARLGRDRRDVAERFRETLTGVSAPLVGVVANGDESGAYGAYSYGYGAEPVGLDTDSARAG